MSAVASSSGAGGRDCGGSGADATPGSSGVGGSNTGASGPGWSGLTIKEILEKVDLFNITVDEDEDPIKGEKVLVGKPANRNNAKQDKRTVVSSSNPESAFLGPKLWDKSISLPVLEDDAIDTEFSIMNIDDFLNENNISLDTEDLGNFGDVSNDGSGGEGDSGGRSSCSGQSKADEESPNSQQQQHQEQQLEQLHDPSQQHHTTSMQQMTDDKMGMMVTGGLDDIVQQPTQSPMDMMTYHHRRFRHHQFHQQQLLQQQQQQQQEADQKRQQQEQKEAYLRQQGRPEHSKKTQKRKEPSSTATTSTTSPTGKLITNNILPKDSNTDFLYAESKRAKLQREKEERRRRQLEEEAEVAAQLAAAGRLHGDEHLAALHRHMTASPSPPEVEFNPDPRDLALATVPGANFDPTRRAFSVDELRPQPIIRKRKKHFIPTDKKDERYWEKRVKNNVAARRSREARRLKENQIALRAAFLEKENATLKMELQAALAESERLGRERDELAHKIKRYEEGGSSSRRS